MRGILLFLLIVALGTGLDISSKHLVFQALDGHSDPSLSSSVTVIPGFFSLRCVINPGGIWGWWKGYSGILLVLRFAALLIIFYLLLHTDPEKHLFIAALALILAGAVGNLWDSLWFGHVRDFLDFDLWIYRWPTFNIADAFITIGVGLGLLQFVLDWRRGKEHGAGRVVQKEHGSEPE